MRKSQNMNKCNECEEYGNDSLRNCTDCLGSFHDSCHSDETISKKTRASSCPSCVRIYANAIKDRNQKIEAHKENRRNAKLELELENEGDDEISEEVDFQEDNIEFITC
uniref:Zinc finger PHD-type domain-containing protein n=1 Tax=Megaselia scalaris TaxID=36166 RepID=T1GHG3_MEGSC